MISAGIQEAVVMFDRALTLFPKLPKAHYFKGIALYDLGKYDAAVESYDNALTLDPSDINAWYNKAATLAQVGRNREALDTCERLIALKYDNAEAWILKGIALYELGRYQDAISAYDHALAIDPSHAKVYYNKGIALADLGRMRRPLLRTGWRSISSPTIQRLFTIWGSPSTRSDGSMKPLAPLNGRTCSIFRCMGLVLSCIYSRKTGTV